MKRLLLVLLLAVATACANTFSAAAASVNGHEISREVIDAAVESQLASNPSADDPETRNQLARDVLSALIQQALLTDIASRRGIKAEPAEIDSQMEEIRASFATEEEFQQQLKIAGLDLEQLRERLGVRLIQTALAKELAPPPSASDLRKAYQEQSARFREVQVKHILYAAEPGAEAAAREKAQRTLTSLRSGSASFRELAKNSDDPSSATTGGVLADADGNLPGWIPVASLDPAFGTAAFQADKGQLIGPVKSSFGFHVIVLIAKRVTPFEKVKELLTDEIQTQTGQESVEAAVSEAGAVANVLVNPRYGDWDPETRSVVPHISYIPADQPSPSPSPSDLPLIPPDDHSDEG